MACPRHVKYVNNVRESTYKTAMINKKLGIHISKGIYLIQTLWPCTLH